tara:strand:+ start:809 stop:1849 length:1041 start_codon:yes stop_codon:yes gene_type:complete
MHNIVLISSPLQALIVSQIITQNKSIFLGENKTTIFCESKYKLSTPKIIEIIYIPNNRNYTNLKQSLFIIKENIKSKCNLWVSEILYPVNNAIYTYLKKNSFLNKINFFDEGMVTYYLQKISFMYLVREILKIIYISFKYNVRLTIPSRNLHSGNYLNGTLYVICPELLQEPIKNAKQIIFNINDLGVPFRFNNLFDGLAKDKSLLFISQPLHRITSKKEFYSLINAMLKSIKSLGVKRCFIKLHPSESIDDFNKYYKRFNFIPVNVGNNPTEIIFNNLPPNLILMSINSSSLIFANKFGFNGKVYSFGLDWVHSQYSSIWTDIFNTQAPIFIKAGVKLLMFKDYK